MWVPKRGHTKGVALRRRNYERSAEREHILGPFELRDADQRHDFAVEVRAERLRFEALDSSGGNTGLVEIAAFAAP